MLGVGPVGAPSRPHTVLVLEHPPAQVWPLLTIGSADFANIAMAEWPLAVAASSGTLSASSGTRDGRRIADAFLRHARSCGRPSSVRSRSSHWLVCSVPNARPPRARRRPRPACTMTTHASTALVCACQQSVPSVRLIESRVPGQRALPSTTRPCILSPSAGSVPEMGAQLGSRAVADPEVGREGSK